MFDTQIKLNLMFISKISITYVENFLGSLSKKF